MLSTFQDKRLNGLSQNLYHVDYVHSLSTFDGYG